MRAILFDEATGPDIRNVPDPVGTGTPDALAVRAAALTNLDIAVATGRHYFSSTIRDTVVGREAVVETAAGNRLFVNALGIPTPFGSMAERTLADIRCGLPVPDGVSDDLAAAIGNAGLAAWLPLSWRACLKAGETVLVLGATGVTGRIAVAAAKRLGAGRVIAVGRNPDILERLLTEGADQIVRIGEISDFAADLSQAAGDGVDIVLDYLNGPPAEAALQVMARNGRMVQIGSPLARGITLAAQTARRGSLDVLGFAYYHAPIAAQAEAYAALCSAAQAGHLTVPLTSLPLAGFGEAWDGQRSGSRTRYVLRP